MNYCTCDTREAHPASECVTPGARADEIFADDVRAMLVALGLDGLDPGEQEPWTARLATEDPRAYLDLTLGEDAP